MTVEFLVFSAYGFGFSFWATMFLSAALRYLPVTYAIDNPQVLILSIVPALLWPLWIIPYILTSLLNAVLSDLHRP
jgi:hypothetical protein